MFHSIVKCEKRDDCQSSNCQPKKMTSLPITNSVPSILKCQKSALLTANSNICLYLASPLNYFQAVFKCEKNVLTMNPKIWLYPASSSISVTPSPSLKKKQHYCTKILQTQCNSPTMTKTCSTLGEGNSIQCNTAPLQ